MSESFSIIKSGKGVDHIVLDNYEHRRYGNVGTTSYWRCVNANCTGKFILTNNEIVKKFYHNHERDTTALIKITQRNNAKKVAQSENFFRIKEINDKATMETINSGDQPRDEIIASLQTFNQLRKTIQRARAKRLPDLPRTIEDIVIPEIFLSSANGISLRSSENKMLVFVTYEFLSYLCLSKHVYCDGTFRSVPRMFQSLYTMHVMKKGIMFPIVYVLLPDSTISTYLSLLRTIQDLCTENDLVWNPTKFTLDFEAAAIKAIQITFPNCELKCCLFHYAQSLWRNVGKHGLIERYKPDFTCIHMDNCIWVYVYSVPKTNELNWLPIEYLYFFLISLFQRIY